MHQLARSVREILVATDTYRRTMADGIEVSTTEAAVLGHLLHDGDQTPSVIAARAGLSPASATSLIDRLEAAGFVARRPHPTDRRRILVGLTPRGHSAITTMFSLFSSDLEAALARSDPRLHTDPTLRAALTDLLSAMAASLRARAGDAAGVRAAIESAMTGTAGTAGTRHADRGPSGA